MPTSKNPWHDFFLSHFAAYRDGTQVSRDAYQLKNNPGGPRLFKVKQKDRSRAVISFMWKNFDVDPQTLCERLRKCGFETRVKERYLEVDIQSLEQAKRSLNVFLAMLSQEPRFQI